ncbi:hypothetical protein [Anaerorhabdus furcosa]|uniref:hypothetical protein n=1 Tax=Anaerorhabdus furcosa TaxID=118967 RepID=UPI0011775B64|nr:hypothetical protein [Anaerorhabdus furcosa]
MKTIKKQFVESLNSYTYSGINKKLNEFNMNYSLSNYMKHSSLLFITLGLLCYSTTKSLRITLLITLLYLVAIPFVVYQKKRQLFKINLITSIFIYTQSILMYLREDKTVVDILRECEESNNNFLRRDLKEVNQYILKTTDVLTGLESLENKYTYSIVINAHIILKHKLIDGIVNQNLIDYLYTNIENYEIAFNEYINKRRSNNYLFYLILGLNAFGVYSLTNFITLQSNNQNSVMQAVLTLYYILNLITIIIYENWCTNTLVLE